MAASFINIYPSIHSSCSSSSSSSSSSFINNSSICTCTTINTTTTTFQFPSRRSRPNYKPSKSKTHLVTSSIHTMPNTNDAVMQQPQSFPLRDKHILFTAPSIYAPRLSSALLSRQARALHMPMISTQPLRQAQTTELHGAVLTLSEYDILVFPSRSSIYHFTQALTSALSVTSPGSGPDSAAAAAIDVGILVRASGVKIAALGADALAVRDMLHVEPDIIPPSATPKALAQLIAADADLHGKRVLVPVPLVEGMAEPPVIPDMLRMLQHDASCTVSAVPAYVTAPSSAHRVRVELDLLKQQQPAVIHAIVISSVGEAMALHSVLSQAAMLDPFLTRVRNGDLLVAAHGPVTAKGLIGVFGLDGDDADRVIVSNDWSSFDGVVNALENAQIERTTREGKLLTVDDYE